MIQSVLLLLLAVIIIDIDCTRRVGYIYNAAYVSNDTSIVISYKNTCAECICDGFVSSVPPLYVGLNCYKNNKTCVLFANYSTLSLVKIDLDSTFIFLQQPPLQNKTTDSPLLSGVTVAGYENGTAGTANNALNNPWGLVVDENDTIYVADFRNARVMKVEAGSLTGSIVAGTGGRGISPRQLMYPAEIVVDANLNIYVNDDFNYRITLWGKNSSSGVIMAGNGTSGNSASTIGESVGLTVDSKGNIYVSDKANHRVMRWAPNATSGILVAGTGLRGNNMQQLNSPYGLYLDENNSYLYIADWANHRIQRYRLGTTTNGTTVAGGNGPGSGSHQLWEPYGVCVSKKTGDIYIADWANHRIQRWSPGATTGVTIIGITGMSGIDATLLNTPTNLALSVNESFLYVSDMLNNRVQRFKLP